MRVYLCRGNVGMAEHLLDGADIGPVLDEMCCERMAKRVRRYISQAAFRGVFLYCEKNNLARHRPSRTTDKHILNADIFLFAAHGDIAS